MEQDVNSDTIPGTAPASKHRNKTTFNAELSKKANAVRVAAPATVPDDKVQWFRTLAEQEQDELLLRGLRESEFIAQELDRQQMLSTNKNERMKTGFAVRVGIYNDKRNKQQSQSAPQNLIINLFNSSSAGPRLSQTLGCHGVTARVAQVVDSTVGSVPQEGVVVEQEQEQGQIVKEQE